MRIGDKVIDKNGYTGVVTNIFPETDQIQVQQKENVWCTYDNERQLTVLNSECQGQILCAEENELLNCLRTKYDCALAIFNVCTQKWCLLGRNKNEVVCTLSEHMLTLSRDSIHELDEICSF